MLWWDGGLVVVDVVRRRWLLLNANISCIINEIFMDWVFFEEQFFENWYVVRGISFIKNISIIAIFRDEDRFFS